MCYFCLCYLALSVSYCLVITYWKRADLLAFLCLMSSCVLVACLGSGVVLNFAKIPKLLHSSLLPLDKHESLF